MRPYESKVIQNVRTRDGGMLLSRKYCDGHKHIQHAFEQLKGRDKPLTKMPVQLGTCDGSCKSAEPTLSAKPIKGPLPNPPARKRRKRRRGGQNRRH